MKRKNHIHRFDNGLVLLAEEMEWSESVACSLLVPGGSIHDPENRLGLAGMVCEMLMRGAGQYDARELIEAYENLGCEHNESPGQSFTSYGTAMLAENLDPVLELLAVNILQPVFPADQLESARAVAVQDVIGIEDEPARKMMLELGRNFFPDPWGRSGFGTLETLEKIKPNDIKSFYERYYQPDGAIISVAGRIEWEPLRDKIGLLFGGWKKKPIPEVVEKNIGEMRVHIPYESAQTHIGIAFPRVPFRDPDYLLAWSGYSVLSDGLSSRLFTEMREKRGLCYSVYANYLTLRHLGAISCYCASAAERAEESLEVLLGELARLSEGIDDAELNRIRIRAKTSLVMQQESTGSRSGSIARDWYHLERIRTMEEIEHAVENLDKNRIARFWKDNPAGPFHIVTLGLS